MQNVFLDSKRNEKCNAFTIILCSLIFFYITLFFVEKVLRLKMVLVENWTKMVIYLNILFLIKLIEQISQLKNTTKNVKNGKHSIFAKPKILTDCKKLCV